MAKTPQMHVGNSGQQGAVSCLLYNILHALDAPACPNEVSAIESALCTPEWTPARINRVELGSAEARYDYFSPLSILGEEIRFLLKHDLRAHYIDVFNPYEFAMSGRDHLAESSNARLGLNLPTHAATKGFSDEALEVWRQRTVHQVAEYFQVPDRFCYEKRMPELPELVAAVKAGAVVRLPWERTLSRSHVALAYAVDEYEQPLVHLPAFPEVSPFALSWHYIAAETWRPQSGAVIYWPAW